MDGNLKVLTNNYCKDCFKSVVDDTAPDIFLLMSGDDMTCPCCGKKGPVVGHYFKFGEHKVTSDGKHIVGEPRYVGINPNYSPWGKSYPYADVENWRGSSNNSEDNHE